MAVRIVGKYELREQLGGDYVRVSTCSDPLDDTITLATIERFVAKGQFAEAAKRVHVKTLVQRLPMSTREALGLATCYAERKNIPVVYTETDSDD